MKEKILETGSAVVQCAFMYNYELNYAKDYDTVWYRSERIGGDNPFGSFMLNKKWILEEEFNNHMMRFQQVTVSELFISVKYILTFQAGLTATEVDFDQKPKDPGPEPLRMEHFYFPLGLWFVGLLISLFCFLAEVISNWIRKRSAGRLSDMEGAEVDQVQVSEDPDKFQ